MKVEVRCNLSSLGASASGAIWGQIWLECDGHGFPEKEWHDMPIALTYELLSVARREESGSALQRVRFFDGPFWVDLGFAEDQYMVIAESQREGVELRCCTSREEFAESIRALALDLVDQCRLMGWEDQVDVRRLASLLQR